MIASAALATTALVAALVLIRLPKRIYGAVAILASAIEVAIALDLLSLHIKGVPLALVLGAILAVTGALSVSRASTKLVIVAGTVVSFIGCLQVVTALDLF